MSPLDPPSVSGWTAYYQEPLFYELLVNADTYAKHMELVHLLCNAGVSVSTPYSNPSSFLLKINFIAFAQSLSNPSNPNILIDDALIRLYAYPVAQAFKDYLKSFLLSGQTADYYWTNAWADYTANPNNVTYKTIVESRLRSMIAYMLSQAEYLLA
jgi:archaellum component FlaF (FlaF/FlaG flagellin family)